MPRLRSRVGPQGEVYIPKTVRDALGIRPGDEVFFSAHQDHVHLEKATSGEWDDLFERMPRLRLPQRSDVDQLVEEEIEKDIRDEAE
jgi:AbrB family looped-hinge helix DNA binding protein